MITIEHALGATTTLIDRVGMTGTGTYLLTGACDHIGQSGQPCLQLTLEDAQGSVTGFVWPEFRPYVGQIVTPIPVAVTASVQNFRDQPQLKVHAMAPMAPDQVASATALLPRRRCPDSAVHALARLSELEHDLPDPLNRFLRAVLLDPLIGLPLLRCRASVQHHHAFVGGLLVHSTEMLDQADELTRKVIPHDDWSPHLAQLGYFLHDLGKLKTVGELRRPQFALAVRHEFATIELLAPHLRKLEQRDLALAVAIRHLLGFLATPARARTTPNHVIAEIVEKLDQLSAAGHNRRDLDYLLHGPGEQGPREPLRGSTAAASAPHGQAADLW